MLKLIELARQGKSWLQDASWSYLFGVGYFLMGVAALVSINAARGGIRMQLMHLLLTAALVLLSAKLFAQGYGGAARFRAASRQGAPWSARLAALLPRLLIMQTRMDRVHLAACAAWIGRRPPPPPAPGARFTIQQRSSHATLIMLGLLSTLVDLPLTTFMASMITKDPGVQSTIHLVMGALVVYSLVWLLGERRLMQGSAHVLGTAELELVIAGRLAARIPLAALEGAEPMSEPAAAWRKLRGVPLRDTLSGAPTPLDRPNVVLTLAPNAGATLRRWQLDCAAPRHLFLYVDQPSQFIAALRRTRAH